MRNLSPKPMVFILRLLIPRKIPSKTRPRILDVGFSFVALFLLSIPVASATACNVISFKLMNELFPLFLGSLLLLLPFLFLLQMSLNCCCSISNGNSLSAFQEI